MKKLIVLTVAAMALIVTRSNAQKSDGAAAAHQAREGRDDAAAARDKGDVKGAQAGATKAEQGAKNAPGNKEAARDAKEAREAAQEAQAKHDKPGQNTHYDKK